MAQLLPNGRQQFLDANGNPLVGGLVYFYIPNTTTPKDTWQDSAKSALNTNPVVCDARGQATIYGDGDYRQILQDAQGNQIWDKNLSAPSVGPSTYVSESDPSAQAQSYGLWFDTSNSLIKQRSADNSSWIEIAPLLGPLLALANIVGSDVSTPLNVVSYGSNANGYWVRFAGGLQICFNPSLSFSSEGTSVAVGSIFGSPDNLIWNFPSQFASTPISFFRCRSGITDAICGLGSQASGATNYAYFRVYSPTQFATATPGVYSCLAIGLWK